MGIHSWFHSSSSSLRVVLAAMTTIFIILSTTGFASAVKEHLPVFRSMAFWCSSTDFPDVCNFLTRTIKDNGTQEQAARLVLLGAQEKVKQGITWIDSAILKTDADSDFLTMKRLQSCREDYNRTIHDLDEVLKMTKDVAVFPHKIDWLTLDGHVSSGLRGMTSPCDDHFNATTNPAKGITDQFDKMIHILMSFASGHSDDNIAAPDDY